MNAQQQETQAYHLGRAAFALLTCLATLVLIFAGGVVTSKNVGLSVPDWPTSYGYHMWNMPFSMWKGGVLYEHLHRVIASATGCLVLSLTIWLQLTEKRKWVRLLSIACLASVVLQGVLGGMTVLLSLPTTVSVLHAILAQLFLCLTVALAYSLSRQGCKSPAAHQRLHSRHFIVAAALVAILVLGQLALAAFMRHDMKHQGGVAIPDFPRVAGSLMPKLNSESLAWVNDWREQAVWEHGSTFELQSPIKAYQMHTHFTHRCMAGLIVVALGYLTVAARRNYSGPHPVMITLRIVGGILIVEVLLGMLTVWSNKGELITSLHVVTGAALLASLVLAGMQAFSPSAILPTDRERPPS